MAYSERIKNFERIRSYMKEFYVYGFKTRDEYEKKSGRTYDNERRRIESYLGDYMGFHQTPSGKTVFLSIDSRSASQNPLYQAWKVKSFTDGDITLHFILFDILNKPELALSIAEITDKIDREYLSCFQEPMIFDESTVRKKLNEYAALGLIQMHKQGKKVLYRRSGTMDLSGAGDALKFFSETGLCGVIGSFLLDQSGKIEGCGQFLSFKHHYITYALDSEVMKLLLEAISGRRCVKFTYAAPYKKEPAIEDVVPLKIFVSVQSGRQHLLAYSKRIHTIRSYRLDYIQNVALGNPAEDFNGQRAVLAQMQQHMWGVSISKKCRTEHVEFQIRIGDGEEYIYHRLLREKRCGAVERVDQNTCRFLADVYDTSEMVPWIRTFIGRLVSLNFSNRTVENQFKQDLEQLYCQYGLGGEGDALS